MEYYSNDPSADTLHKVRGQIDEVKDVMVQNIEKLIERGEKIEILVDKTKNLNEQALEFNKRSRQVKNVMWWKNCKVMTLLVVIILMILFFVVTMACGGFTYEWR